MYHSALTHLPAATYGTAGLSTWLRENIITVVVLIIGIGVLWAARSGNIAKGVTMVGGLIIGLAVLGLASGTNATDLANFVVGLFKS